ncbi:MAG: ABC transporter permease [Cytophagales bacterium]|nr:ABC transporter permease [Cytophagales bacterium]
MKQQPPKFLLNLFNWFCHPEIKRYVEGDLIEIFQHYVKTKGVKVAYWKLTIEIIKLLRPSLMKSLEGSLRLNYYGVFKNHVQASMRNLRKQAAFSTINMLGLAISMSVAILMLIFHSELSAFDDFHQHRDRIFRVTSTQVGGAHSMEINRATASFFIGNELKSKVSGVEEVAILIDDLQADLVASGKGISVDGFYGTPDFFRVFSFALKHGNPMTALNEPNAVVLTEQAAKKLFGEEDPMGQVIEVFKNEFIEKAIVRGVVEDPPVNSHLRFDAIFSLSTLEEHVTDPYVKNLKSNPGELSDANVYVLLATDQPPRMIDQIMAQMIDGYNQTIEHPITHQLQPMESFVFSDTFRGIVGPTFSQRRSWVMMGLALIIVLSACFNYTNLSLARAIRRTKEIGIRKVNGASSPQVFTMFMTEAVILSMFALGVGFCLFLWLRPEFLKLSIDWSSGHNMFLLEVKNHHLLLFLGLALTIGFLSGIVPAFFHAKINAYSLFRDASKLKMYSGVSLRNVLIATQFAISIGLITTAILIRNQYEFVLNYDHGYNPTNILSVIVEGDYIDILENGCQQLPEITEISKSSWVLGVGGDNLKISIAKNEDLSQSTPFLVNSVDRNYLQMHDITMIEGRSFDRDLGPNEQPKEIIVNESFLKKLNLGSPQEAIGKQIGYYKRKLTIIGVTEETVSIGLTKMLFEPFAFLQTSDHSNYTSLNLKIETSDLVGTISKIEKIYNPLDIVHPFNASFYNDMIVRSYQSRKSEFLTISFLAFLAVVISTLGLLGMAVFSAENRIKEISIRKILGAGSLDLGVLLSRNFFIMTVIAGLIAVPGAIYIADTHLLVDFWKRAPIGTEETLIGFFLVLIIGIITTGRIIQQVISKNPIHYLRDE